MSHIHQVYLPLPPRSSSAASKSRSWIGNRLAVVVSYRHVFIFFSHFSYFLPDWVQVFVSIFQPETLWHLGRLGSPTYHAHAYQFLTRSIMIELSLLIFFWQTHVQKCIDLLDGGKGNPILRDAGTEGGGWAVAAACPHPPNFDQMGTWSSPTLIKLSINPMTSHG